MNATLRPPVPSTATLGPGPPAGLGVVTPKGTFAAALKKFSAVVRRPRMKLTSAVPAATLPGVPVSLTSFVQLDT
jgi:hypothetical protein